MCVFCGGKLEILFVIDIVVCGIDIDDLIYVIYLELLDIVD